MGRIQVYPAPLRSVKAAPMISHSWAAASRFRSSAFRACSSYAAAAVDRNTRCKARRSSSSCSTSSGGSRCALAEGGRSSDCRLMRTRTKAKKINATPMAETVTNTLCPGRACSDKVSPNTFVPAAAAASATVRTTLTRVARRRAFSTSASQERTAHARWISEEVHAASLRTKATMTATHRRSQLRLGIGRVPLPRTQKYWPLAEAGGNRTHRRKHYLATGRL